MSYVRFGHDYLEPNVAGSNVADFFLFCLQSLRAGSDVQFATYEYLHEKWAYICAVRGGHVALRIVTDLASERPVRWVLRCAAGIDTTLLLLLPLRHGEQHGRRGRTARVSAAVRSRDRPPRSHSR